MGVEPDAPTQVAPTGLAPAEYDHEALLAWAFDPADDDAQTVRFTPRRITAMSVAVSLVAIAAAGVVALVYLKDRSPEVPVVVAAPSSSAPATSVEPIRVPTLITSAPPLPPRKPVETVPPTAEPAPPTKHIITDEEAAPYDDQFIQRLEASGWTLYNRALTVQTAHNVCYDLQEGVSQAEEARRVMNQDPTIPVQGAAQFVVYASAIYPGCP